MTGRARKSAAISRHRRRMPRPLRCRPCRRSSPRVSSQRRRRAFAAPGTASRGPGVMDHGRQGVPPEEGGPGPQQHHGAHRQSGVPVDSPDVEAQQRHLGETLPVQGRPQQPDQAGAPAGVPRLGNQHTGAGGVVPPGPEGGEHLTGDEDEGHAQIVVETALPSPLQFPPVPSQQHRLPRSDAKAYRSRGNQSSSRDGISSVRFSAMGPPPFSSIPVISREIQGGNGYKSTAGPEPLPCPPVCGKLDRKRSRPPGRRAACKEDPHEAELFRRRSVRHRQLPLPGRGRQRILVDCGLQQGRDEVSNEAFPFAAKTIDSVLVTHAHIDHSGRIPMLIKEGFRGRILTTRLTASLMDIMLQDSAHIQEQDAEWKNRKGERSGAPHVEPLYTIEDALRVGEFMTTCEYGQDHRPVPGRAGGVRGRRPPAGLRLHHRHRHGGRRHQRTGVLRRHRQRGPAHHPGPGLFRRARTTW